MTTYTNIPLEAMQCEKYTISSSGWKLYDVIQLKLNHNLCIDTVYILNIVHDGIIFLTGVDLLHM